VIANHDVEAIPERPALFGRVEVQLGKQIVPRSLISNG
jgi:hypothetical protein